MEDYMPVILAATAFLVIGLLALLLKNMFFDDSGLKARIDKKTGSVTDPSYTAYFDGAGNKIINWDKVRIPDWIERDLLPVNENSRPGMDIDTINGIVIHYVANPGTTAAQNRNYFAGLANGGDGRSVSSHFIIGIDGEIIQCVPMGEVAYASNDRNHDTISIECCHEEESGEFTRETYESLVKLTAWLSDTYLVKTDDVIRHYDVTGKLCPKYFVDHEDAWENFKMDVVKARKL